MTDNFQKIILTLENFRGIKKKTISLDFGKNYNLDGPSGVGKTTCMESIDWCLYGKVTKIYPADVGQNKIETSVNILINSKNNITNIKRSTNPKIFVIKIKQIDSSNKTNIYKDLVAQNYIDDLYGKRDFWLITSYMKQKELNPLLNSSSTAKVELINSIAFSECNPAEYIDKIEEEIKIVTIKSEKLETEFKFNLNLLKSQMELYNINSEDLSVDDQLETIDKTKREVVTYNLMLEKIASHVLKVESIKKEIEQVKHKISLIKVVDINDIKSKLNDRKEELLLTKEYEKLLELKERYDNLFSKLKKIDINYDPPKDIEYNNEQHLNDIKTAELQIESFKKKASKLNVKYSRDSINDEIKIVSDKIIIVESINDIKETKRLENICVKIEKDLTVKKEELRQYNLYNIEDDINNLTIEAKINEKEAEIEKIKISYDSIEKQENEISDSKDKLENDVRSLTAEIKKIETEKEMAKIIKNCPHCQGKIKIIDGELIKEDKVYDYGSIDSAKKLNDELILSKSSLSKVILDIKNISTLKTKELKNIKDKENLLISDKRSLESNIYKLKNKHEMKIETFNSHIAQLLSELKEVENKYQKQKEKTADFDNNLIDCKESIQELAVKLSELKSIKIPSSYPKYSYKEMVEYNSYISNLKHNEEIMEDINKLSFDNNTFVKRKDMRNIKIINSDIKKIEEELDKEMGEISNSIYLNDKLKELSDNLCVMLSEDIPIKKDVELLIKNKELYIEKLNNVIILKKNRDLLIPLKEKKKKTYKELIDLGKLKNIIINSEY